MKIVVKNNKHILGKNCNKLMPLITTLSLGQYTIINTSCLNCGITYKQEVEKELFTNEEIEHFKSKLKD